MSSKNRSSVTIRGIIVTKINFLIFGIYFLRDIVLTRTVGINSDLDTVFAALIIPMFLANILSSPYLNVLTTQFCELEEKNDQISLLISSLKKVFTLYIPIALTGLILINIFAGRFLASNSETFLNEYKSLFYYTILIFLLSGPLAIFNALLNSIGKAINTTLCGAFVPTICILAVIFEPFSGIALPKLFIYSLLIGQTCNLIAVILLLFKYGYIKKPKHLNSSINWQQYTHLVIGGAFLYTITPIDQIMSSNIMSGSISSITLTHKIVNFVTNLSNNVLTSVLLPFFASKQLMSGVDKTDDLKYFYRIGNILTFLGAILLFFLAPFIIKIMLKNDNISLKQIDVVVSLIRLGSIQIPFLFGFLIIQKYLTGQNKNYIVFMVSIGIIFSNICLNYILRDTYGIQGITLATTLSLYFGSALLMFFSVKENLFQKKTAFKYFSGWTTALIITAASI